MQVIYNAKTDTLYIRLDDQKQPVINQRITDEIVFDVGDGGKIVGIEVLDASAHVNLKNLLPVEFEIPASAPSTPA